MRRWLLTTALLGLGGCADLLGYRDVVYEEPDDSTGSGTTATTTGAGGEGGAGGSKNIICVPGTKKPCAYSGPAGTENVGACRPAEQECDADGTSYGPCEGEILPAAEVCHNQIDEDCDGAACAAPLWSRLWGDAGTQRVVDFAVNAEGTLMVAGNFEGTLDMAMPPLVSGEVVSFAAQLDPSGLGVWQEQLPFPVRAVDVRSAGQSLVAGSQGGTSTVRTYLPEGTELWTKSFSGMAVAASGARFGIEDDLVLVGDFVTNINFGIKSLSSAGSFDIFLATLNSQDGSVSAAERIGDADSQRSGRVGVLSTGSRVLTGVDVSMAGAKAEFVVRQIDGANVPEWEKRYDGPVLASDVHVGAGTSICIGYVSSTWLMISKLSVAGDEAWSRYFTGEDFLTSAEGMEPSVSVALESGGNVIFVARASGTMDFGGGQLGAVGEVSEFLVQLDADGKHLWSKRIGPVGLLGGCRVAVVSSGARVLGCSEETRLLDLGSGPLEGKGGLDIVLAAFGP